jgi:hypothetical protein
VNGDAKRSRPQNSFGELRRFGLRVRRINGAHVLAQILLLIVGAILGAITGHILW